MRSKRESFSEMKEISPFLLIEREERKMSRVFTKGTPLYELEVTMTTIPGFDKRGSGLYFYKRLKDPEAGKCKYCLDYKTKKGCIHDKCPYLFERAALGTLDYKTFMLEEHKSITYLPSFQIRIYQMINNFDGNMFLSAEHGYRYYRVYHELKRKVYSVKSYILGKVVKEKIQNPTASAEYMEKH